METQRASELLDDMGISAMDPMRGTFIDFAHRSTEEQMFRFMVKQHQMSENQDRIVASIDDLDRRFIEHASTSKWLGKERVINVLSGLGPLGAYLTWLAFGQPTPPNLK